MNSKRNINTEKVTLKNNTLHYILLIYDTAIESKVNSGKLPLLNCKDVFFEVIYQKESKQNTFVLYQKEHHQHYSHSSRENLISYLNNILK